MISTTRRVTLGAIITAPLASLPVTSAPAGDARLVALVHDYEQTHALLDTEGERLDQQRWKPDHTEFNRLCRRCGQMRAAIAVWPAKDMSDVLLKVRAFACANDLPSSWQDIRWDLEQQDGHAYDRDIAAAVLLDLAGMLGFGKCD